MPRFLNGAVGRATAQAAVLSAIVAGGVGYAHLDKDVTLTVDGETERVSALSGTVADLLKKEGITVGERDLVSPDPATELADGDRVVVRYARPITLTIDGQPQKYWTTELTVAAALKALGMRSDGARLSVSRSTRISRSGMRMQLNTPKSMTVLVGDDRRRFTTTAATVGAALREQRLAADADDRLTRNGTLIEAGSKVTSGLVVRLTRLARDQVRRTESVAHKVIRRYDDDKAEGTTAVLREGRDGQRRAVYRVLRKDGRIVSRELVSATLTTKPVSEIVVVGTKEPEPTSSASSSSSSSSSSSGSSSGSTSSGGLNWAALAQCESGGNPTIVSSNGLYYGLYQFSLPTWRSVGGSGLPSQASPAEQTKRAQMLYDKAGAGQWPVCGSRLFS